VTLPTGYDERKALPIGTGVIDYFLDALAEIAKVSCAGNAQHNPEEHARGELFWNREKSTDEYNTLVRHLAERGGVDTDGMLHMAKAAWRALAMLQKECEARYGYPRPRGCVPPAMRAKPTVVGVSAAWADVNVNVSAPKADVVVVQLFRLGDRVRSTGLDYHKFLKPGEVFEGVISEGPDSDGDYIVRNGARERWFQPDRLERLEPNAAPSSDAR
jgi:hypothetical protein